MPRKRDPLKRLTADEQWEVELLCYDIAELYFRLGGKLCECGRIAIDKACDRCKALLSR